MRKIWFHLVKDMVSPCERYGFTLQKIWFRKVKSKVSSTGKFHSGLPKKTKIGLSYTDFVIYLYIKWLQKKQPTLEPALKPALNPHWNLH